LFNHKALAKVFRARVLEGIKQAGLSLPERYHEKWVDCKNVGTGEKALVYLGRYLYRGVLPEKSIVANRDGNVTFRYQNSETRKMETRTLSGVEFLRKILLHILPKGFRRARNFGFLHPNSKLVKLAQLIKQVAIPPPRPRPVVNCTGCGKPMRIARARVRCEGNALRSLAPVWETTM
jgi:hypothetical protein